MEDQGDHPQDAYELGRAAAAKLKEHNEELSHELPDALQNLFSDTEFQEAIVVSGVVTNQRQTLTPIASYSYAAGTSHHNASSTRMITRRAQQNQIDQQYYQSRPSTASPQKSCIPLEEPPIKKSSSHVSLELGKAARLSKSRKIEQDQAHSRGDVEETTLTSTVENNHGQEKAVPSFVLLGTGTTGGVGGDDLESSNEGAISNLNNAEEEQGNCLCCNVPLEEDTSSRNPENNLILRDLLWFSLGMKKLFDRTSSSFPFCDNCSSKIQKLSEICSKIGQLEDDFNEIRDSLSEGIVSKHLHMTKASDGITPQRKGLLKIQVLNRMRKVYSNIVPGKQLLKEASRYLQSISTETEKKSDSMSDSEGTDDETGTSSTVFECRFCDRTFKNKNAMSVHEQKSHKADSSKLQCNICDKYFPTPKNLADHKKRHVATEKLYKCKFCDKKFSSKAYCKSHANRHVQFRPFQCTICSEKYYLMRYLTAHFRKRHPDMDPITNFKKLAPPPEIK